MKMHRFEEIWLVFAVAVIVISMAITGYQTFALGMGPPSSTETIDPDGYLQDVLDFTEIEATSEKGHSILEREEGE